MTSSAKSPPGSGTKKKLTRADMRKLIDQLIKFFKEHPEYEHPELPSDTEERRQKAA